MNDFGKFKQELPCQEAFYSLLTERKISDKEYERLNVWNKFEMKTMEDIYKNKLLSTSKLNFLYRNKWE